MRITDKIPSDWRDLEYKVADILNEARYNTVVNKEIETVRGNVHIDVYAEDAISNPKSIFLIECKYWSSDIPQTVVHSFRTIVNDSGANYGLIIAKNKFQSGCYEAIKNTNVSLLNWFEFLDLFENRWLNSVLDHLDSLSAPLREYTDPLDVNEKYDLLTQEGKKQYQKLCTEYVGYSLYSSRFLYEFETGTKDINKVHIDRVIKKAIESGLISAEITCYKDYFNFLKLKCIEGIRLFQELLN